MRLNKYWLNAVTVWISLGLVVPPAMASQLSPNLTQTSQKTPPTVTSDSPEVGGIKVPAAVPLSAVTNSEVAVPTVGAKKSTETTTQAAKAEVKKEINMAPKTTALKPEDLVQKEAVKPSGQEVAPQPVAKPAPVKEVPASALSQTAEMNAAKAPRAADVAKVEQAVAATTDDGLPRGKAQPTVSTPMRAADKKAVSEAEKKREEEGVYFNVSGEDIREIIKQISRVTNKNFIIDDKIRGEVTIISEKKMTKEEVYEAFLSALDVAGYTTVPGPAGLIKIVKKRDALTKPIPIYTDKTPYTDKFITRLLTLKNISAIDMANAIKGLVSKEGNLFAYPSTNTLIITDSGTNIDRIIRMVQELDTEGPQEVLEIIPVEYADVNDMADKITKLFGGEQSSSSRPTRRATTRRGVRNTPAATDALPTLSKVISDERTNSLIILASKITIAKVRDVIRRLDKPLVGPDEGDIHILYLKNAKASEIAEVLTGITQAAQQNTNQPGNQQRRGATAARTTRTARQPAAPNEAFEALFGSIKSIRADDNTNALIIQANAKDFRLLVDRIIAKLDIPRRQVYIEATIMELNISKGRELGTGALGGLNINLGGNDFALFGNTFPFIPSITSNSGVGGSTTDNPIAITPPFSDNPINFPKFFAAFIAQSDETELNVLSTPNILTLDNTEARIKVGDTVPFLTGSALTTGGVQTSNIQREDIALELVVNPQITEGNNVRLKIKQTIEDFSQANNPLEATAGPATSIREIDSEVVVPDQQTVVIGGLMQDRDSSRKTKIPLLGDIPILGYLFKATSHAKRKVNLLIFLTPNIIREPQDFLLVLKKKLDQRNRFIDDHFGERNRKRIRETISRHNDTILEFESATSSINEPEFLPTDPLLGDPQLNGGLEVGTPLPPESIQSANDLSSIESPSSDTRRGKKQPRGSSTKISIEDFSDLAPTDSKGQATPPPPSAPVEAPKAKKSAKAAPPPPPPASSSKEPENTSLPSDIDLAF